MVCLTSILFYSTFIRARREGTTVVLGFETLREKEVSIVYLYVCRFVSTGISYRHHAPGTKSKRTALFFCVGSRQFCRALLLVLHILLHRTCAPNYER